jgi:hypothetical protein
MVFGCILLNSINHVNGLWYQNVFCHFLKTAFSGGSTSSTWFLALLLGDLEDGIEI